MKAHAWICVVGDALEFEDSPEKFMKYCDGIRIETALAPSSSYPSSGDDVGHDRMYHVRVDDFRVERIHVQVDPDN